MAASMKMALQWVSVISILGCFRLVFAAATSKPVIVSLDAKWKSTPILLEASEYIAKENNELFWNFVNSVGELEPQSISDHHEESMHHLALKHASQVLSPLQMRLLRFALAMRAYSPTIEMYNQVAREANPTQECDAFVDVNQMVSCDKHAFKAFLTLAESRPPPILFKSDHKYPGHYSTNVTVILYGQLGTESFHEYHKELKNMAEEGKINYVLRHYVKNPPDRKVRLSGYGVELAIKSTEYKAKDDTKVEEEGQSSDAPDKEDEQQGFLFSKLRELHPELKGNLAEFRKHLIESTSEMAPLKAWQLQDLSFQAAQRVMSSPATESLSILTDISQNFPIKARWLSKTVVEEAMRQEILQNQQIFDRAFSVPPGESALFINGLQADLDIYDVFTLLDTMRSEARLMEGLHALGIKGDQLTAVLGLDLRDMESGYAVDIRDTSVQWINNLETESRYAGWPGSLQEMLRPTFPGMLRHIRRNLFNLVYVVDPTDLSFKECIKMAESFSVHQAPIRIGFVFVVNKEKTVDGKNDAGVAMVRAFNFIKQDRSAAKGLSFITDVYERSEGDKVTADQVIEEFTNSYPGENTDLVFGENSDYDDDRIRAVSFYEKMGLGQVPQVLLNGVPLKKKSLNVDAFEEAVVTEILRLTPTIQRAVYHGHLTDRMDVLEWEMTQNNVMPRLNMRVLQGGNNYLDLTKNTDSSLVQDPQAFGNLATTEMIGSMMGSLHYVTKKEDSALRAMTTWIVADLETPEGRSLAYDALKHLKHSNSMRIGIINNPTESANKDGSSHSITKAIHVAIETLPRNMAKSFITKLLKEENVEALKTKVKSLNDYDVHGMDMEKYNAALSKQTLGFLQTHQIFCARALDFKPGQRGVIINGKVIGPLKPDEVFNTEDFVLLDKYTSTVSADKVMKEIKKLNLEEEKASDMVMKVASLLTSVPQEESRKNVDYHGNQHSVLKISGNPDSPAYDVVAILDPLTRAAQKIVPLIMVLREAVNVNINIYMNCKEKHSEMPLKSFYRYVLDPELKFAVDSSIASGPVAQFQNLPESPILTLNMNPPEGWLVESIKSKYDLDNIHLEEVQNSVRAEFELEYLLLEGHCYDTTTGQPPRGLQFILGTNSTPDVMDTIVMANLGYFQLKAKPGAWMLRLREGRSREIYDISSHEYTDSPPDAADVVVVMDSFKSKIIKVRVSKKLGKEREDLLGDSDDTGGGGLWNSISNMLSGQSWWDRLVKLVFRMQFPSDKFTGGTSITDEDGDDTLNIFSLASGHLYERFLRIMMLSVLKNTKSKVKFWFLKNYLSPTFKEFIPHMAKQYGFQYELIQYKWPRWLHQQTEKQRMIWGYKILFLDVLFPLHVNKIIFVDADQIVRTDLKELHDLDLEGAPYGYTPFCDSRTEMEGFRFWKSGYWNSHLAGRRYHISALYVVDLKKFRKIAAGDRLRGQYQGLSQDPNSLSNLDQDLPNNMIHQVAIKSLPQEWLWCETWCSDSSKASAKTIDLCNNPLTKEPKLQAAVRIVPEWTSYDTEVKTLWDRFHRNNKQSSDKSTDSQKTQKKDEL